MADLDTISDFATSEVGDSQTAEPTAETSTTAAPAPKDTAQAAPQDTQQKQRTSRKEVENKRYEDLRSFSDRKINELNAKIKANEERYAKYADLDPLLPDLKKILEQKRQTELQEKWQQNPQEAAEQRAKEAEQRMQELLNQTIAPFQQQAQMAEMKQTVNDNISYLKESYGDQAFNDAAPIMKELLDNTAQQYGQQVSDLLARNPDHLFAAAFGQLAIKMIRENKSQQAQGSQNKQTLAKQAAGISKPNRTIKTSTDNTSRESIEQAAFDFLQGK